MFRALIALIEETQHHLHIWHGCSKSAAQHIIDHGIRLSGSDFGRAFRAVASPQQAEGAIILEFHVEDDYRLLNLAITKDAAIWHKYAGHIHDKHLPQRLIADGIDGLYAPDDGFHIYNPQAVTFTRVYAGVVDDPLEQTDVHELDEFALGGLARCTAVTVNAILQHFHKPAITLNDVPVDQPGVMRILVARGLTYRPYPSEVGRTMQQFGGFHRAGTWCLITQGHAMALIDGELFDAENRSLDGRKLLAAYQMQPR